MWYTMDDVEGLVQHLQRKEDNTASRIDLIYGNGFSQPTINLAETLNIVEVERDEEEGDASVTMMPIESWLGEAPSVA